MHRADVLRLLSACVLFGGLAGLPAGCALLPATHVTSGETSYYLEDPNQPTPPDGFFPGGTRVRILSEQDSYSQVRAKDGRTAWVWSGALKTVEEWEKTAGD